MQQQNLSCCGKRHAARTSPGTPKAPVQLTFGILRTFYPTRRSGDERGLGDDRPEIKSPGYVEKAPPEGGSPCGESNTWQEHHATAPLDDGPHLPLKYTPKHNRLQPVST